MLFHLIILIQFIVLISSAPTNRNVPDQNEMMNTFINNLTEMASSSESPTEDLLLPESFQHRTNYELIGNGFEGDMIFPEGFNPLRPIPEPRGVAIAGPRPWPSNTVPYDLSAITSSSHRNFIVQAMETLMYDVATPISGQTSRKSCVQFRARTSSDRYYLRITYGSGCSGTVGYLPGSNMQMTLNNPGCFTSGIIQHELLHILGFYHEQSRPDRDSYIQVNYNNIQRGLEYNFDRFQWNRDVLNQNTEYDLQSIMHYDAYAFSRNNQPTIVAKGAYRGPLGQREKLTSIDISEVRKYYNC